MEWKVWCSEIQYKLQQNITSKRIFLYVVWHYNTPSHVHQMYSNLANILEKRISSSLILFWITIYFTLSLPKKEDFWTAHLKCTSEKLKWQRSSSSSSNGISKMSTKKKIVYIRLGNSQLLTSDVIVHLFCEQNSVLLHLGKKWSRLSSKFIKKVKFLNELMFSLQFRFQLLHCFLHQYDDFSSLFSGRWRT